MHIKSILTAAFGLTLLGTMPALARRPATHYNQWRNLLRHPEPAGDLQPGHATPGPARQSPSKHLRLPHRHQGLHLRLTPPHQINRPDPTSGPVDLHGFHSNVKSEAICRPSRPSDSSKLTF